MEYVGFAPEVYGFPKPRIPVLPWLSRNALTVRASRPGDTLALQPRVEFYQRARYALTEAFRLCDVGPETTVLIPAYHCRSMLDPALRLGAEIGLYSVGVDLQPDLEDIANCLVACSRPAKALLVVHYFGFPQDLGALKQLCDRQGLALIEDCSHCLPAAPVTDTIGNVGRFSVWSPYKFFPTEDGGMLVPARTAQMPRKAMRQPGLGNEIRAVARGFQRSSKRVDLPTPSALVTQVCALPDDRSSADSDRRLSSDTSSDYYDAVDEQVTCLASTRWILRHSNTRRLIQMRRDNFTRWVRAVADLPNCRALFSTVPTNCVPYMFPLYLAQPKIDFLVLKHLGMPIWRWDDLAVSGCTVAADYRLHLLHLPCHQELTDAQMAWMTSALAEVMRMPPKSEHTS